MFKFSELFKSSRANIILQYYKSKKKLIKRYRTLLTDLIIQNIIELKITPTPIFFADIAEEIVNFFPTEVKETYFLHV